MYIGREGRFLRNDSFENILCNLPMQVLLGHLLAI